MRQNLIQAEPSGALGLGEKPVGELKKLVRLRCECVWFLKSIGLLVIVFFLACVAIGRVQPSDSMQMTSRAASRSLGSKFPHWTKACLRDLLARQTHLRPIDRGKAAVVDVLLPPGLHSRVTELWYRKISDDIARSRRMPEKEVLWFFRSMIFSLHLRFVPRGALKREAGTRPAACPSAAWKQEGADEEGPGRRARK